MNFPSFWRLDSCRPIEFRDGQRDALGILAHRMSEDDVLGVSFITETKCRSFSSVPWNESSQKTIGMTPQTSCLAVCFPCHGDPNGSPIFVHKIKFGFINLEASQRRCRKVGGFCSEGVFGWAETDFVLIYISLRIQICPKKGIPPIFLF